MDDRADHQMCLQMSSADTIYQVDQTEQQSQMQQVVVVVVVAVAVVVVVVVQCSVGVVPCRVE